jgi:hypothetical protein
VKMWPISIVAESPQMPAAYAWEVRQIYSRPPSEAAYYACVGVARGTQAIDTGLVIIESADAPVRRAYLDYPEWDEWLRLERGGVVQAINGDIFVIIDCLH